MYTIVTVPMRLRDQILMLRFFLYYIITITVTNWTPCIWKFLLNSYWTPTGLLLESLYWTPVYPFLRNPQFLVIPVGIYQDSSRTGIPNLYGDQPI